MASRKVWDGVRKILPQKDYSQNFRIRKAARVRCNKSSYHPKIRGSQTAVLWLPDIHKSEEQDHGKNFNRNKQFLYSLAFISVAYAMAEEEAKQESSEIIASADAIYEKAEYAELYDLLSKHKDSKNAEILWRLTRAAYEYSALSSTPSDVKKRLVYEGFQIAEEAVNIDRNLFACHKWYGIMLSEVGDYEGTKKKIENSYKIKEHFMKSIELNPSDATSHYLLGVWFFTFADLPWYQRKLAATIFASPPECTYKEAQDHFLHAESIDPNFYTANHLMLAKTYMKTGEKESARNWLNKLVEQQPGTTEDDKKNIEEAKKLLKSL